MARTVMNCGTTAELTLRCSAFRSSVCQRDPTLGVAVVGRVSRVVRDQLLGILRGDGIAVLWESRSLRYEVAARH
jgi:hypothetical protein